MSGILGGGGQTISTSSPMIGAMRVQTSAFGMAIPAVWGRTRIPGNLIWYADFKAIPHTTTTSSGGGGGKGGGGNVSSSNTTYTYETAVAIGLCEGPIGGIGAAWAGKSQNALADLGLTDFRGTYPQAPWGYLETYHPQQAIGYQGIAYVAGASYSLGDNANLPNHTFEVLARAPFNAGAGIYDANPRDFLTELLTAEHFGAGFPSAKLGDLTHYSNYCVALGIFLSPALLEQKPAQEYVAELARITNSEPVWSEGVLKVIPYGDEAVTGNGATFTPVVTPVYDLSDDDFQAPEGEDPVRLVRKTQADAFNFVQVEFLDRSNQYNVDIADAKDQANIELHGLRTMDPIKAHWICERSVADLAAWLILQRVLYVRNEYEFEVPFNYDLLEPMDLVTLTDPGLGLNLTPVRIKSIDDGADELLKIIAEEFPAGVATASRYPSQAGAGYSVNYNIAPSGVNAPVFFEAPDLLTQSGLEIWLAVSGGANWSGCEVWVSRDDATYKRVGTIHGGARHGVLTAPLPASADPDMTGTLKVDISVSGGTLIGGTQADADAFNTLCYVDGEFVSFQAATLTGAWRYDLGSYLRRGAYGTAIGDHQAGTQFARIDQAIFKYPFTADMIGTPLYIKLPSFNQFGGGRQTLDEVHPFTYTVTGYALKSPLPDVPNLVSTYRNNQTVLAWGGVSDFRTVDYEVRHGATWQTALVLGRTPLLEFAAASDGTYWVAAHYGNAQGVHAYSATPSSVVVSGAVLPANVLASFDEAAAGWVGSATGGAFYDAPEGVVKLMGAGDVLDITDFIAEPTIEYYGGVAPLGYYQIPAAHEVDIGVAQACNCAVSFAASSDDPYHEFVYEADVLAMASWMGEFAGKSSVKVQIDVAPDSGVWQGWRDFIPGQYLARKFRFRAVLASSDPSVTAILSQFNFSVDVPDRLDVGTDVAVPSGGLTVAYSRPFHVVPNVQITILDAQPGDVVEFTAPSTGGGFSMRIVNGGSGVARRVNWFAKGY